MLTRPMDAARDATDHGKDEEAGLVEAARVDPQAFGALYDRYVDTVYRYLYRQTGRREVAEDLTSITFMRALAGLERFRAGQPFAPWLLRIAHNALVDHRRVAARTVPLDEGVEGGLAEAHDPREIGALEQVEGFLAYTVGLSRDQRDALALRFIADLSTEQTASALGRSVAATKMLVARAIKTLRARVPRDADTREEWEWGWDERAVGTRGPVKDLRRPPATHATQWASVIRWRELSWLVLAPTVTPRRATRRSRRTCAPNSCARTDSDGSKANNTRAPAPLRGLAGEWP